VRAGQRHSPRSSWNCAFLALWSWLLPSWLGFHSEAFRAERWRGARCCARNRLYPASFGWLSLWVIFGRADLEALTVAFAAVVTTSVLVHLGEEPAPRKIFRVEYQEYCRIVSRKLPRLRSRTE
jgi:protein-S-isoprenylcysteine O-methyltransferase Ste14